MELGTDTVVVITGAGSGIGLAMAHSFGAAGCKLVLADVNADDLTTADGEVRAAHGVDTMTSITDVSQADQVEALAAATVERFGAVHVICNNAGVAGKGDPWLGPIETWEWTLGVNLWGVIYGVRAFLPRILESGGGHVVNTASIAGLYPGFGPAYDASKHAVVALTEGLHHAMEMSPIPVGVSCLCPAWVKTGIIDADRNWPDHLGERPELDAGQEVMFNYVRTAIDEGMPGSRDWSRSRRQSPQFARTATGCSRTPISSRSPWNGSTRSARGPIPSNRTKHPACRRASR